MAAKKPSKANVSKDDLLHYYREMLLIRRFEEKAGQLIASSVVCEHLRAARGRTAFLNICPSCRQRILERKRLGPRERKTPRHGCCGPGPRSRMHRIGHLQGLAPVCRYQCQSGCQQNSLHVAHSVHSLSILSSFTTPFIAEDDFGLSLLHPRCVSVCGGRIPVIRIGFVQLDDAVHLKHDRDQAPPSPSPASRA